MLAVEGCVVIFVQPYAKRIQGTPVDIGGLVKKVREGEAFPENDTLLTLVAYPLHSFF